MTYTLSARHDVWMLYAALHRDSYSLASHRETSLSPSAADVRAQSTLHSRCDIFYGITKQRSPQQARRESPESGQTVLVPPANGPERTCCKPRSKPPTPEKRETTRMLQRNYCSTTLPRAGQLHAQARCRSKLA